MSVRLERYSAHALRAARQGKEIAHLVHGQEWLRDERPDTAARHSTILGSIRTTLREASFEPQRHDPFIIRGKDRRAPLLGLARIIGDQIISHPQSERLVKGTAMDYWLTDGAGAETHAAVAEAMIQEALGMEAARRGGVMMEMEITIPEDKDQPAELTVSGRPLVLDAIAVVGQSQKHRPEGLIEKYMHVSGNPTTLSVPPPLEDPFNFTRSGEVAQMYHMYREYLPQPPIHLLPFDV